MHTPQRESREFPYHHVYFEVLYKVAGGIVSPWFVIPFEVESFPDELASKQAATGLTSPLAED